MFLSLILCKLLSNDTGYKELPKRCAQQYNVTSKFAQTQTRILVNLFRSTVMSENLDKINYGNSVFFHPVDLPESSLDAQYPK